MGFRMSPGAERLLHSKMDKEELTENGFFITELAFTGHIIMFWFQLSSLEKEIKNNRYVD